MLRRSGHGAIFLIGLTQEQLDDPNIPIDHQVHLAQPVPCTNAGCGTSWACPNPTAP